MKSGLNLKKKCLPVIEQVELNPGKCNFKWKENFFSSKTVGYHVKENPKEKSQNINIQYPTNAQNFSPVLKFIALAVYLMCFFQRSQNSATQIPHPLHKKWSFLLRISPVLQ